MRPTLLEAKLAALPLPLPPGAFGFDVVVFVPVLVFSPTVCTWDSGFRVQGLGLG